MTIEQTSTGGAGYNGIHTRGGSNKVAIPTKIPYRTKPFPWPYPNSALQGCVGTQGTSKARVARPKNPYYGPFSGPYLGNWPWKENRQGWLNGWAVPVRD